MRYLGFDGGDRQMGVAGYRKKGLYKELRTFGSISFLVVLVVVMAVIAVARNAQTKNETTGQGRQLNSFLYNSADSFPVIEYAAEEVDPTLPDFVLIEHKGPHVVEFYSPMCSHCRNFRKKYVDIARQTTDIAQNRTREASSNNNDTDNDDNSMIKFYAVSCKAYYKICRHYSINSYPTVRLYPAAEGQGKNNSSNYIKVNYWQLRPHDILRKLGIESNDGFSGARVPPMIARLAGNSGEMMKMEMADGSSATASLSALTAPAVDYQKTMVKKNELYADMYRSFHFSLKYEVYASNEPLDSDSREALHQWLHLLQMSMPHSWSEIHNLLNALVADFDSIVQGEQHLSNILNRYPPQMEMKWSESCSHGEKGMGFTCGLWKLFHLMTLGVVEWNSSLLKNGNSILQNKRISPVEAATILRNFVQHFFRCEVCRTEFVETFDSCIQNHCHALFASTTNKANSDPSLLTMVDWIQLPLWLFETHNAVTRRLLHEKAEREGWQQPVSRRDEQDVEWPSRTSCPKCWRPDAANNEAAAESDKTMSLFDSDHVYRFLKREYWLEDNVAASQSLRKNEGNKKINYGTDRFSLWLPVYLSMFLAIAWYSRGMVTRTKVKQ